MEWQFGSKASGLTIKGGLKMKGCKMEGLMYMLLGFSIIV